MIHNVDKIEQQFLELFPNGLETLEWQDLKKKYDDRKIVEFFKEKINKKYIQRTLDENTYDELIDEIQRKLSQGKFVSTFEKIAFRNFISEREVRKPFLIALQKLISNYCEETFMDFVSILMSLKFFKENANACKWPVITFFTFYALDSCYPVKPTSVKKAITLLDAPIKYSPTPNFKTYEEMNNMYEEFRLSSNLTKKEPKIIAHALLYTVGLR